MCWVVRGVLGGVSLEGKELVMTKKKHGEKESDAGEDQGMDALPGRLSSWFKHLIQWLGYRGETRRV